jgi:two-component system phosphate regulon sensor histidine kinase PhoR
VLSIVLRTLVKNSIESTPDEGEIVVSLDSAPEGVLLIVEDRGVGIRVADQEFVFDGFHHTQDTEEYSSRKPFDFNAGGKGLELLRLKMLSEAGYFGISFESHRCKYIPTARDHCPGRISECSHVQDVRGCRESGGTTFSVLFSGSPDDKRA